MGWLEGIPFKSCRINHWAPHVPNEGTPKYGTETRYRFHIGRPFSLEHPVGKLLSSNGPVLWNQEVNVARLALDDASAEAQANADLVH